jgi:hypothetical protein
VIKSVKPQNGKRIRHQIDKVTYDRVIQFATSLEEVS